MRQKEFNTLRIENKIDILPIAAEVNFKRILVNQANNLQTVSLFQT